MYDVAYEIYNQVNRELKSLFWECLKHQVRNPLRVSMPFSMVMQAAMIDDILSIDVNTKLT